MTSVIENLLTKTKTIASGGDPKIRPGQAESFTSACVSGDCIRQGDLYLIVVDSVPNDYVEVLTPKDEDRQLVPGNTQGAKHCLRSLEGVKIFKPKVWNENALQGPAMVVDKEAVVDHPTHGAVVVPAGLIIVCGYQRVWDQEQKAARRAAD